MARTSNVPVPEGSDWFGWGLAIESIERHGLTWDEYHAMLNAQNCECAICERHPSSVGALVVDHDHSTGKVRGLLCQSCNCGLGLFLDHPYYLRRAADYLHERGFGGPKGDEGDTVALASELTKWQLAAYAAFD